jgi:hypothetical protein
MLKQMELKAVALILYLRDKRYLEIYKPVCSKTREERLRTEPLTGGGAAGGDDASSNSRRRRKRRRLV